MGKALLKGGIFGGIILYIWMMISWMALPWHCPTFEKFANEEAVTAAIMANSSKSGIYLLPNFCADTKEMKNRSESLRKGPFVFSSIRRDGVNMSSPRPYITAFIVYLIGAFIVTHLLSHTRNLSYWHGVWFVTLIGILVGLLSSAPNWNWWGFSFQFTLVQFLDWVIGWFLAGLAISAVVRRVNRSDDLSYKNDR